MSSRSPNKADQYLLNALDRRAEEDALRSLYLSTGLVDFCSNDYLGLARSHELFERTHRYLLQHDLLYNGSGGSRLLAGNHAFTEETEKYLADFYISEAALLFNSGYSANLGLFSSLGQADTYILYDELIHASIHDGIRLSKSTSFMFKHNDLQHLELRLQGIKGTAFVAVESVYSMDGDVAPLNELVALCEKYDAHLIVDEAHATGLFGKQGKGKTIALQLQERIFARIYTFGKALGVHGAVIAGSKTLRSYLVNFSRPFIYTTAMSVHGIAAIRCAHEYLQEIPQTIEKAHQLIRYFQHKTDENQQLHYIPSSSCIQSIIIKGNVQVKGVAARLAEQGMDVRPILSPTVKKGTERLRICLHSFNSEQEVDRLFEVLS